MRTYLRTLVGIFLTASVVLAVGYAGLAGYHFSASGRQFGGPNVAAALVPVLALQVLVGVVLWHLTGAPLPEPSGPPPDYRPMRWVLRVVAQTLMGIGGLVIAAGVVYAWDQLFVRPGYEVVPAFIALFVILVAFGATALGGLLWCAVRVAYPDPQTGEPVPTRPPGG
ncbi:MAG TPA: hypothetical protein VH092_30255 [Urbifossiella sp.]|jgi:hypothetical protein|nr:hypothetical protein [Urbifossiella sp.]